MVWSEAHPNHIDSLLWSKAVKGFVLRFAHNGTISQTFCAESKTDMGVRRTDFWGGQPIFLDWAKDFFQSFYSQNVL